MNSKSSGYYKINSDYLIVGFNETAKELYPQLVMGKKCHQVLMGLDEPCPVCPVANKIRGPRTYLDPIRHIYETVDAVEVSEGSGCPGYALVFSTVGEGERLTSTLPDGENALRLISAVNILGAVYTDVFGVNLNSHETMVYRSTFDIHEKEDLRDNPFDYERIVDSYIRNHVIAEDRERVRRALDITEIRRLLQNVSNYKIHYRVLRDQKLHHFYLKVARDKDNYEPDNVIIAFACEDDEIERKEISSAIEPGGGSTKRKLLVVEDNVINRELLTELLSEEYEVITAENGMEGLKLLQAHFRELSAILLDIVMPVMDGYQFMEAVRHDTMLAMVPIIVMTGSMEKDAEERCRVLGATEFMTKPYNPAVVLNRLKAIIRLRETSAALRAIEYDDLTGLYTRQAFFHHARILIDSHPDRAYSVLILDIENFKFVNSIYGESLGDSVLQYIADGIRKVLVKGIAARYGGDQIAVISEADTMSDINAMEHCFGNLFRTAPVPNLSYKIGVYALLDRSMSVMQICDRAMEAVKAIKHNYDTVIAFYDGPMNHQQQREHQMQNAFEDALKNEEFKLWYQPKYDAVTEKIVGAEALVRWIRESGELIPPGLFIPLFERDRRIGRLDAYVFRKVCELQARREKEGKSLIPISVNMSRNTVYQEKTAGHYEEIIRRTGISSSLVPIELTESAAFLSTQIRNLTNILKEKGFCLIMDDFGSGYSSLTSLCILPFDEVKLDKSLIDFIGNEKNDIILEATITAAKKMGMRVVAEGVEQKSQLDFLRKNNCDVIQGYYFAKPVPEAVFEQMLEQELKTKQDDTGSKHVIR